MEKRKYAVGEKVVLGEKVEKRLERFCDAFFSIQQQRDALLQQENHIQIRVWQMIEDLTPADINSQVFDLEMRLAEVSCSREKRDKECGVNPGDFLSFLMKCAPGKNEDDKDEDEDNCSLRSCEVHPDCKKGV